MALKSNNMVNFMAICILAWLVKTSYALDCYSCNVSTSTVDEDGCFGIGSIKKCAGNSVCLAATYEIKSGIVQTYTTMQSCFPEMAGQECDRFIKSQRDLHRAETVTPNTCYVCTADNCNKSKVNANRGSTSRVGAATFIASILSLCVAKLVIF